LTSFRPSPSRHNTASNMKSRYTKQGRSALYTPLSACLYIQIHYSRIGMYVCKKISYRRLPALTRLGFYKTRNWLYRWRRRRAAAILYMRDNRISGVQAAPPQRFDVQIISVLDVTNRRGCRRIKKRKRKISLQYRGQ